MAYTKQLYTLQGLATELGIDRRTVASALSSIQPEGKPRGTTGYDGWYMLTALEALGWVKGRATSAGDLDPIQERARKDAALADKTEMQNAVTRGELFSGAVVTRLVVDAFSKVRTRLLALPVKLAPIVIHLETIPEVQAVISDGVNDALGELSEQSTLRAAGADTARSLEDAGGVVQDAEASTAPDDQPMGGQRAAAKPRSERRARAVGHQAG